MAITVAVLAEAVRDNYTAETVTDARMLRAIESALRYYSRYNPVIVTAELTTVANQYDYSLPADCVQLLELEYWPFGSPYSTSEDFQLWGSKPIAATMVDQVLRNMDRDQRIDAYGGYFEVIVAGPEGTVRLSPVPTSAINVPYRYYRVHELNEAQTSMPTLPPEDLEILGDLVVVALLSKWLNDFVTEPDYVRGLGKVTKRHLPQSITNRIRTLRQGVQQRYGGTVCVTG